MIAAPITAQARAKNELLWFLSRSRARTVRSMREFAESEVVIPDGPFQGRRFKCDRQPYTTLWFDAVDSGNWNRCVATGPTQSGKSLACFVIPLIYHLFEIGETVICGLPDMDMAVDKWREDILPVIEQSRYRNMMPIRGGGSRGGRVESIPFRNGATLKFMSGGGGDKSRAGFTSRVVVITETDGMDKPGATSRESDKITQLEARTRAYGSRKRIYMECTLSTEQGRTWQEYIAGTRSKIVLPCPHCGHYVLPERQHFTGWHEASSQAEARGFGKFGCPDCGEIWTPEQRTEANRHIRLVHQGQEVDDGGNVPGDAVATDTLGFRWSAIHNLFLTPADLAADEWRAARSADEDNAEREMRQFVWCLPVAPSKQDETTLHAEEIMLRQSNWPRGLVPPDCTILTAAIDLGKYLCHWIVVGWRPDASCYIVDYARIEVASDSMALEQALMVSLRQFRDLVKDGWPVSQEFSASPGKNRLTPTHVLVDAGYMTPVVYAFVRENRNPFHPAVGRGASQQRSQSYHHPTSGGNTVRHIGENYHVNHQQADRVDLVEMDADAWKTWIHQRLTTPLDQPGAMRLYKAPPQEHMSLAKHLTAERKTEEFVAGKGVVTRWERIRRQNHWFDALYNAAVAGHAAGVRLIREQKVYAPPIRPYGVISKGFTNQRF
jgi:phage terminase large subunit GpA-like protein